MSTRDYGCFFCTGKSQDPNGTCPECHAVINVELYLLHQKLNGEYVTKEVLGRGFNGWTLRAEDAYQSFAVKLIPLHRLKNGGLADKEAKSLAKCSPHRNIARFFRRFTSTIKGREMPVKVLGLVFEYIPNSRPLREFVGDTSLRLNRGDVVSILTGIASGLSRMHSEELWHDDLHDDNVLIRDVASDENLPERFEAKIIDFGSTETLDKSRQEKPDRSDYVYLAKHIYSLVARYEAGIADALSPADRTLAFRLRSLAHQIADTDVSRRNLTPVDVIREIKVAQDQSSTGHNYPSFKQMKEQSKVSLSEPLANTNALNLAPQDIALLFRDSLQWQDQLQKSEPILVVGPRGCGKTMLLRYLSIASRARPRPDEETQEQVAKRLAADPYIGFLINLGQHRTPFLRSAYKALEGTNAALAEDFCREYLNLCLGFELIRTLIWLDAEKLFPLLPDDVTLIESLVGDLFIKRDACPRAGLHADVETIERRVVELSNLAHPTGYVPSGFCGDDVLHRFGHTLRTVSWTAGKEVWFLLDDYSVTVLPELAQKAYNPVLFRPSTDVRIKMSSEGEGPLLIDTLERKYREGRELTKVDLGEVYFRASESAGRRFFEAILEARFEETRKGSLEGLQKLLCEHNEESSFGAYILKTKRPGDTRFYGFGLLCRLCSGDVSFIIELLRSLTGGFLGTIRKPMPALAQDKVVKGFAHRQLAELRAIAVHGEKLYTFANGVGNLIKSYLLKSKGKERPDERLRIEIEGTGELSADAQRLHEALLRHSVLISGGAGKSRRGLQTRKYFFRRLFSPCFPFSPTRRGCIALTLQEYEQWLLDPARIWSEAPATETLALED